MVKEMKTTPSLIDASTFQMFYVLNIDPKLKRKIYRPQKQLMMYMRVMS